MAEVQERLEEMTVYKCPKCGCSGEEIKGWHAYNQLGTPIGFSRVMAERKRRYTEQISEPCSRCGGRGFLLKSK